MSDSFDITQIPEDPSEWKEWAIVNGPHFGDLVSSVHTRLVAMVTVMIAAVAAREIKRANELADALERMAIK